MRRLRLVAAAVAVLTALIDWLLALDPAMPGGIVALVALSAACLAAFTPFEALDPPARKLAFLASLLFLAGNAMALALAINAGAQPTPLALLVATVGSGVALSIWSFAIRNRRRRPGWRNYYDS